MVASRSYLDLHGVPLNPTDLALHDALIYSTVQGDARWHLSGVNGQLEAVQVRGPLRSNNLSVLLLAARSGLGLATLPKYVAQESLPGRFLEEILTDWTLPAQEIHSVYPSPQLVPTKVTSFVAWLQGQFVPGWWSVDVDQKPSP